MNIYLIGFMGSGKSSAGRRIATLLRWKFEDIDRMVEGREHMTVTEIFASRGEEYFRRAESEALRKISDSTRTVVACGGGTPCTSENMNIMRSTGVIVYLKLSVEDLVSRLKRSGNKRPLLKVAETKELDKRVTDLLRIRSPWYEQADLIIDAVNTDEEKMTAMIADTVRLKGAYL